MILHGGHLPEPFLADELWYTIDRPDYYLCIGGDDDCFLACGSHFLSLVNAAHGKGWSVVKNLADSFHFNNSFSSYPYVSGSSAVDIRSGLHSIAMDYQNDATLRDIRVTQLHTRCFCIYNASR